MTYKENITAILECYFTGFKKEIIDSACNRILEQQPCEDAISREEAIGAVANLFEMSEYPHPYPQGKPIRLRDIKKKLKHLPSIQPKPKVGHWIYERCDMYSCSVCRHWHTDLDEKMNYCPNCGAKMVEPQESEDKE